MPALSFITYHLSVSLASSAFPRLVSPQAESRANGLESELSSVKEELRREQKQRQEDRNAHEEELTRCAFRQRLLMIVVITSYQILGTFSAALQAH